MTRQTGMTDDCRQCANAVKAYDAAWADLHQAAAAYMDAWAVPDDDAWAAYEATAAAAYDDAWVAFSEARAAYDKKGLVE